MYRSLSRIVIILLTLLVLAPSAEAQNKQSRTTARKTTRTEQKQPQKQPQKQTGKQSQKQTQSRNRTAADVKKAKERAQGQIKEAQRKITLNTQETEKRLNQLTLLEGEIEQCNTRIAGLTSEIEGYNSRIAVVSDSIADLDNRLEAITARYVRSIRKSQSHGQQMSDLAFIFSSESFAQAYRRARALHQFSKWRKRRSVEISEIRTRLDARRNELSALRAKVAGSVSALDNERASLMRKKNETSGLVERLRREGGELQQIISRRQQEAASLDAELDRIIAEETRRQEELRRQQEEAERKAREEAEAKARAEEAAAAEAAAKAEQERIAQAEAKAEAEARKKAEEKAEAEKKAALEKARDEAEREKISRRAEEKAAKEAEEQVKKEREAARKAEQQKIKEEREAYQKRMEEEKKAAKEKAKKGKPVKHTGRNNGRGDVDSPAATETAPTLAPPAPAGASGVAPAADTPSGGNFADYKGRLPFPVSGHYTIVKKFGRQKHPTLPHVETTNSGIDMATGANAAVNCVFDGEVSAVFRPDGYNNVVVIRHGRYMTVYANLGSINVSTGQKVKAGQSIGTVYTDPADPNRSILHFEIRNQREKENPELWLKR